MRTRRGAVNGPSTGSVDARPPPGPSTNDRPLSGGESQNPGAPAPCTPGRTRIVAYARVSTDKQADKGISLEAQRAKFQAYAVAHDVELVEVVADALSGKNTDREGLQRALATLEAGRADGLLVAKLDRLTRDVGDWSDLLKEYFGRFAVFSVEDSIDTRTAMGRFVLNMRIAIAQWERETIAERTRDALTHLRTTGGGTPRLEGLAVVRMRELAAGGASYREIARTLTAEGVPTLKGGRWAPETIRKVLSRT